MWKTLPFYFPGSKCEALRLGVHLILSILLCREKGIWHFQFTGRFSPKKNLEMFYLRMGWMDGWDGISKVSFKFLYPLWVYRTCIYLLIYILKNCHQHSYGFQNFMSSWGSWSKISKLQQVGDVSFFRSKSSLFFSLPLGRPFLRKNTNSLFFCAYSFLLRILLRILRTTAGAH